MVVLTLPLTLLVSTLSGTLFDRDWGHQAVASNLLANGTLRTVVVRDVIPAAIEQDEGQVLRRISSNLEEEDWQQITRLLVPNDWLDEQTGQAIDALLNWLDTEDPAPGIVINSEPVKRRLIGDGSAEAVEILLGSWPACSDRQTTQLEAAFRAGADIPLLICQPPEPLRGVVAGYLSDALHREAREVPSRVDLGQQLTGEDVEGLLEFKRGLRNLRLLARWGLLIPISLLGLIMALAVRSWRQWALWWGLPLALGGLLTFLLAALTRAQSATMAADWTAQMTAPAPLVASLRALLTGLLRASLGRSTAIGLVVLALGATLLAASMFLSGGSGGGRRLRVPASSVGRGDRPSGMFGSSAVR